MLTFKYIFHKGLFFLLYPSDFMFCQLHKGFWNNLFQMKCFHSSTGCPLPPSYGKLFVVISIAVSDTIEEYIHGCSGLETESIFF